MKRTLRFFFRRQNGFALILVMAFLVIAINAPRIAPPQDPNNPTTYRSVGRTTDRVPRPPSSDAPLGTLAGQLDVFYTLVWGTRNALWFGLTVTLFAACFGVVFGAISAYTGGWVNSLMMRFADAFMAVPVIAAIFFFQQLVNIFLVDAGAWIYGDGLIYFEEQPPFFINLLFNLDPVMIALVVFSWMPYARLVNSMVMHLKEMDFIVAARALGSKQGWIIRKHILPNAVTPAVVLAARDVGGMVILQATFTFIGLGGGSSWGSMLSQGRDWVIGLGGNPFIYWWVFVPATLALFFFSLAWNLLGDGLNDWLNPRNY